MLIVIPWSVSDYSDNVIPEKITSDLRFYERNTCSISINEFLYHNPNVIYQDHYKLRFNNYSSIKCFGRITGIDQINHVFYISVGSNVLLGLVIQSCFWILLLSFIKKDSKKDSIQLKDYFSILISPVLYIFGLYAESRYYSKHLYFVDLQDFDIYKNLYTYFLFSTFFVYVILKNRKNNFFYFLPFGFLFMMLLNGFNIYLLMIFFSTFGIKQILDNKVPKYISTIFIFLLCFWTYQSIESAYYLKPDKIRGLSSTFYSSSSTLYWSILIFTFFVGFIIFFKENYKKIQLEKIKINFLYAGVLILLTSLLSANNPYINFLTFYYSGLTKHPTDNPSLFMFNEWGEKVAWRGMFPSAESIGEFYALGLVLLILSILNKKRVSYFEIFISSFSIIGLYASNNKTATLLLVFCALYKFVTVNKPKKLFLFLLSSSLLVLAIFFIRLENLMLDITFTSNNMLRTGYFAGINNQRSSSIEYLFNLEGGIVSLIILIIGQLAFLINRSELWGLFFARYNPSLSEFLFGSGPFDLAKHYGEIDIINTKSFLLPHSSVLNLLIFFGFVITLLIIFYIFYKLVKLKNLNFDSFLILTFIFINLFKSDSILYGSTLLIYFSFLIVNLSSKQKTNT